MRLRASRALCSLASDAPSPSAAAFLAAWQVVIGLEFHVQVATAEKLFSRSPAASGRPANSELSPFDTAEPGSLPRLNPACVDAAVRLGFALGGRVQARSEWDRKHYAYADLPHGFQVTQQRRPVVLGGALWLAAPAEGEAAPTRVTVERVQLEMDTAKTVHRPPLPLLLDFNRAGCALLEVVTAPVLHSGADAVRCVQALQRLLRHARVSAAQLEDGSLRCDVNVSLRSRAAGGPVGGRVEIKNLNSTRSIARAIAHEAHRHAALLQAGLPVPRDTLSFDVASGETRVSRSKESDSGYRFLHEPDLPPLCLSDDYLREMRDSVPELPDAARARLQLELRLPAAQASALTACPHTLAYFDATMRALGGQGDEASSPVTPKTVANWVLGDVLRCAREAGASLQAPPPAAAPPRLAAMLRLLAAGLSGPRAKQALGDAFRGDGAALAEAEAEAAAGGAAGEGGEQELRALCCAVLAEYPAQAAAWRGGRDRMMGLFVGQAVKRSGGRADPVRATELFTELLKAG